MLRTLRLWPWLRSVLMAEVVLVSRLMLMQWYLLLLLLLRIRLNIHFGTT